MRRRDVVHTDDGNDVWMFNGAVIPNIGLNAVAGRPKEEYGVDPTAFDEMRPGCFDVHERVKDMNAGGVLATMNFPSFPSFSGRLFAAADDKDLALAMVQAYNDWHIDEWCGAYPGRFIPMALPVLWDPELCAAEIRRVAAKGCHSITFTENPAALGYPSFHDEYWDPMWRALVDEGTILNIHLGSSGQLAVTAPDAPIDVMITLQPMNICSAAADLLWSRVFKEFPTLKVALSEGGTGWIPYFLDRLDRTYDMHHLWTGQDFGDRLPSRGVPRALPHVLHRRSDRHRAPRRDRHRQHLLGAGLPALRLVVAERARGVRARRGALRRARHGGRTRSPTRTRCAGTASTRSRTARRSSAPSARCAPRSRVTTCRSARWRRAGTRTRRRFRSRRWRRGRRPDRSKIAPRPSLHCPDARADLAEPA